MRILRFIIASLFVMNTESSFSQCVPRDSLWNKVSSIRYSRPNKIDKLKELLKCKAKIKNCPGNTDSTYTQLLLFIGVEYYKRADYIRAVDYTRQAVDIIEAHISEPPTDKFHLPRFYYFLSIYYDSLKLIAQKNDAIDS